MSARNLVLGLMLAAAALTVAPNAIDRRPVLIWNAAASAPIGLYRMQPEDRLAVPDLVVVAPPEPFAAKLEDRAYLPRGVPLLKRILAFRANRLPQPSRDSDRWRRDGGHARKGPPRPTSARLAGPR
jgi:type IV secretory pathway protease TraF